MEKFTNTWKLNTKPLNNLQVKEKDQKINQNISKDKLKQKQNIQNHMG